MEEASGTISRFKRWYSQAGTPQLQVRDEYDAAQSRYILHVPQTMPPTPGQLDKQPMVIPLAVAQLQEGSGVTRERVLNLTEKTQSFAFADVRHGRSRSLLRAFSAPVKVAFDYGDAQLAALVEHDNDGVSRWQAVRELFFRAFDKLRGDGGAVAALDHAGGGLACRLRD
jgi:aminopeptidase N